MKRKYTFDIFPSRLRSKLTTKNNIILNKKETGIDEFKNKNKSTFKKLNKIFKAKN